MELNKKNRLLIIGALLILLGISVYDHGAKILLTALVAIAASLFVELLAAKFKKEKLDFTSYFISPLVITLIISTNVVSHILMVALAVVFGVFFAKLLFGGQDRNVFNPEALGLVFAIISFPAYLLNQKTGNAMGELFVYTTLGLSIILMVFKAISPYTVISYLLTILGVYGLFYLLDNSNASLSSILFGTNIVFVGLFMGTEASTGTKTPIGNIIYGFTLGLLVWLINTKSSNREFAAVYCILLINALSPLIDQFVAAFIVKKAIVTEEVTS